MRLLKGESPQESSPNWDLVCRRSTPGVIVSWKLSMEGLEYGGSPEEIIGQFSSSNLVKRAFEETRRRTKIIPHFLTEKSGLKLVYPVLVQAASRWRRIPVTAFDLLSLDRLRDE